MPMVYLKLFYDQVEALDEYSNEEVGRLIRGAVCYARDGKQPVFTGNERFIWPTLKAHIDRSNAEYDNLCKTRQECGAKGGRPKKAKGFSEKQKVFEEPKGFSENQKNLREENEEEKEEELPPPTPSEGETPDGGGGAAYIANNLRSMTAGNWDELKSYMEDGISMALICYAVDEAAANGKRSWSYVRGILNRFLTEGISTVEQARKTSEKPKEQPEMGYRSKWVGEDDY